MSLIPIIARPFLGSLAGGQLASQLGHNPLQAIGGAIGGKKGEQIGKKIEKGIVDTGKKVGKKVKKLFGFNEGGKVRRPPVAYRRGGTVQGAGSIIVKPIYKSPGFRVGESPRQFNKGGRVKKRTKK